MRKLKIINEIDKFLNFSKTKYKDYFIYITQSYISMNSHMEIICPKHGIYRQTPRMHKEVGCKKCNRLRVNYPTISS